MKRKLFLLLCALLTMIGVQAQNWSGNAPAEGNFFLYNVEAQKFLNNGDPNQTWGTNAYLQAGFGMDITLEANGGAFNLNTNVSNGGDSHYLGTSTWCDGGATPWTFTAVAGQTNTYTISNGGSYLVANDALNDVEYKASTGDAKSWWKLVSLDDFKAAMAAKAYSDTDPMDVSVFIQGRSFARNDGGNNSWTRTYEKNSDYKWIEGSDGSKAAKDGKYYGNEVYNQTFKIEQSLTGLPNGVYEVRCSGFGTNGTTYIYGNETSRPLTSDNAAASGSRFTAYKLIADENKWAGQTSGAFFVSDGNLTIGIKREKNQSTDWCVYDEFRLYYYGPYSDGMDVTGLFITNPSFETGNTTGWTYETSNDHGAKSTTDNTYKMSGSAGDYLFNIWTAGNPISQTLKNLPAGTYKLTAVMGTDANQTFQLTMGDATSSATSVDKGTGVEVAAYCELGALGDLTISATTVNKYFYKVDDFKLYYNPTMPDLEVVEGTMDSDIRTAQTNAVNTYNNNKTPANYYAALTAIANAKASIHEYAQGAAINALITEAAGNYPVAVTSAVTNAACSSSFSGKPLDWTCTNSNAFQVNTWSTEGKTDGSGMTTPFIENWVAADQTLGAGSIRHTSIKNLTAGVYEVGVHARVYRNTNVDITDAAFRLISDVDEKSIDLNTGSSCNYGTSLYGRYKVYKKVIEVGENGSLNIGFDMGDSRNFSWLCFKDLTVRYMGPTMSTGVQTANYADDNYVLSGKRFELTFEGATVEYELNGTPTANVSDGDGFSKDVPLVLNGSANGFYFDFPEGMEAATKYTLSIDADVISHDDEEDEYDGSNTAVNLSLQTPLVLDGTYFLSTTVEEKTKYLSRMTNNDASVDNFGLGFNLTTDKDGVSFIQFLENENYYLDDNNNYKVATKTKRGANTNKWVIVAVDGGYKVRLQVNTNCELTVANTTTGKVEITHGTQNGYVWNFITPEAHETAMQAWVDAQAATAATAAGISATTKADLETALSGYQALDIALPTGYNVSEVQDNFQAGGDLFAEKTLTGLTNGLYKLSLYGYQRISSNVITYAAYGKNAGIGVEYLQANGQQTRMMSVMDVASDEAWDSKDYHGDNGKYYPNNTTGAKAAFDAGNYANDVYVYVTDGTLSYKLYNPSNPQCANWCPYYTFSLTLYSDGMPDVDISTLAGKPMKTEVKTALNTAATTYAGSKTTENYSALQTAIFNAEASAAVYETIHATIDGAAAKYRISSLTDEGQTEWNSRIETINAKYGDGTYANLSDVETDLHNAYIAALTAQGAGSDLTSLIVNPSFEEDKTGWSVNYGSSTSHNTDEIQGTSGSKYFKSWRNTSDGGYVYQTLTLPEGYYRLSAMIGAHQEDGGKRFVKAGSEKTEADITEDYTRMKLSVVFHLTEEGSVQISAGCTGSNEYHADDFRLTYLGQNAVSATIGSTGWTTFSSAYPLDLSGMTASDESEVKAYYASASDESKVTMTSTDATVAAGEGLMLKGTPTATITIPLATTSGSSISDNLLVGCTTETPVAASATCYVLVNNRGTAEFQSLAEHGATIPAGKAYLNVPSAGARLAIVFEEDAPTAISFSEQWGGAERTQLKDGKYLINGKIVIVKNGVKYSTNGQKLN